MRLRLLGRAAVAFVLGAAACLLIGLACGWNGRPGEGPWVFCAIAIGITAARIDHAVRNAG